MGKKKSAALIILITVVLVGLIFMSVATFPVSDVNRYNSLLSIIDLGSDLGGGYTAVYYPEGVISQEEYNRLVENYNSAVEEGENAEEPADLYKPYKGIYLSVEDNVYDETAEDGVIEANEEYLERSVASENSFPTEPITLDENAVEIVSNSDFSGIASAWTLSDDSDQRSGIIATDYTNSDRAYRLIADSSATQTIGAVYGGFEYTLSGSARVSGGQAEFAIEFLDETGAVIGEAQTFTVAEGDAFAEFSGSVTAPEGSVQMRLVLRSAGENAIALFDSISMHRVIDLG